MRPPYATMALYWEWSAPNAAPFCSLAAHCAALSCAVGSSAPLMYWKHFCTSKACCSVKYFWTAVVAASMPLHCAAISAALCGELPGP